MTTHDAKRRLLLASAVASLMTMSGSSLAADAPKAADEKAHCYGINACKGTGDCSGKGHSCSGQNACKGQGHINLPKDLCLRIQNGHLTPKAGEEG